MRKDMIPYYGPFTVISQCHDAMIDRNKRKGRFYFGTQPFGKTIHTSSAELFSLSLWRCLRSSIRSHGHHQNHDYHHNHHHHHHHELGDSAHSIVPLLLLCSSIPLQKSARSSHHHDDDAIIIMMMRRPCRLLQGNRAAQE